MHVEIINFEIDKMEHYSCTTETDSQDGKKQINDVNRKFQSDHQRVVQSKRLD